jgi:D-serine deaminase-like pyridoxal phosphate-dependent protein
MDWTQFNYPLVDADSLTSPSLLVFEDVLDANLQTMLEIAGNPDRLRPHCKTHKIAEIIRKFVDLGVVKHKGATIAECEMLARAGARDVLLAYNLVGPNVDRFVKLVQSYPNVTFSATVDHPIPLRQWDEVLTQAGVKALAVIDIDPGRNRTGVPLGEPAARLCRLIQESRSLRLGGFHLYDGHRHESDVNERRRLVIDFWNQTRDFMNDLGRQGIEVPKVICGGTPTFPIYAELDDPRIELSPGTCTYHDAGYGEKFPDLNAFRPAALVFTRVISRPTANRITLDLGTKAVASDPPMGQRVVFPRLPNATQVLQNEEHLVLETDEAERFTPGDWLLGIPRHVCPCSVLYSSVNVIRDGKRAGEWQIVARGRKIEI